MIPRQHHLQLGDKAPNLTLVNTQGESIELAQYWQEKPIFLSFIRHFGCIFCREWLAKLQANQVWLEAAGLGLVAIAQGKPRHAQRYCGQLAPQVECLTNENTTPYYEYGLQQGSLNELASFAVLKASLRAFAHGATLGKTIGDPKMMPGMFIIDRAGVIRYSYYSQHAGDHPAIEAVLKAARRL